MMSKPYSLRLLPIALLMAVVSLMLGSCYEHHRRGKAGFEFSERQIDSLSFFSTHHYTNNYNFVVKADSLVLLRQLPEEFVSGMQTDSFSVRRGEHLVVADIRMVPEDTIDTVWVQLANDTSAFGWSRETQLLAKAMPDDPISEFISDFSDSHVIIFLAIIVIIGASYLLRSIYRRNARIVHVNDIDSFYPTLLCLIVATAATLYASIQMFDAHVWQHFYFHPTLNPFSVPLPLCIFLLSVWSMLIVGLAAVDDVRHLLPVGEGILYVGGLAAVCAVDYIVFSLTTLYYVGYLLLAAYYYYALRAYFRHHGTRYLCGKCGAKMRHKGVCPRCGAINE